MMISTLNVRERDFAKSRPPIQRKGTIVELSSRGLSRITMKPRAPLSLLFFVLVLNAPAAFGQQGGGGLTITQSRTCSATQSPIASRSGGDSAAVGSDTTGPSLAKPTGNPDVILLVGFSADEVHFNSAPKGSIRFCWGGDSLRVIERRNLPSPVVAGATYRNVYIAAELRAYLNPECLSRALGAAKPSPSAGSDSTCAALGLTTTSSPTSVSRPNGSAH
jgi:hypothetical protein